LQAIAFARPALPDLMQSSVPRGRCPRWIPCHETAGFFGFFRPKKALPPLESSPKSKTECVMNCCTFHSAFLKYDGKSMPIRCHFSVNLASFFRPAVLFQQNQKNFCQKCHREGTNRNQIDGKFLAHFSTIQMPIRQFPQRPFLRRFHGVSLSLNKVFCLQLQRIVKA
jgi:hypothetical protein